MTQDRRNIIDVEGLRIVDIPADGVELTEEELAGVVGGLMKPIPTRIQTPIGVGFDTTA